MTFEFSTLLSPLALGILLGLCLIVFGALSVAFLYHWKEYGMNTRSVQMAPTVYAAVSSVFCLFAIFSYIYLLFI